jgi:hypothetical protein
MNDKILQFESKLKFLKILKKAKISQNKPYLNQFAETQNYKMKCIC